VPITFASRRRIKQTGRMTRKCEKGKREEEKWRHKKEKNKMR
jgi:hypothetical protein